MAAVSLAAALVCGTVGAQGNSANAPGQAFAPSRILVMPRAGLPDAALDKILKENGGGKARRVGKSELRIIDVPPGLEKQMVERLARHPHFKFAELDRPVSTAMAVNDPYAGAAWHIAKIGAASAWDTTRGGGVLIAILDTGVKGDHIDLAPNLVAGWNVIQNNADTSDFMGHGTPVAGTAAALINNGIGVVGVAGQSKIMPLVVTDSTGTSYYSVISQAIVYAADHGARIASASFSGLPFSTAVQSAAQYMKNKGGLVVVAAGNTGAVDNVAPTTSMITVASTESDDSHTPSSTYGNFIVLSAPGTGIYSTSWSGGYGLYNGTSFSTPIVAGTIALMMAANPALTSGQVESLLYQTAVDLGAPGRDAYFGYGRVNAAAAVTAALSVSNAASTVDTSAPTVAVSAPSPGATVTGLVPVDVTAMDNVGVTKVELRVNGALVATDTSSPFGFSWDSTQVGNGMATLIATAYDAAGNSASSPPAAVNVANSAEIVGTPAPSSPDTTAPSVVITSPSSSQLSQGNVTIATSANDNAGVKGITQTLYINGTVTAFGNGASLSYKWNASKLKAGPYVVQVVAKDAAGNTSTVTRQFVK